MKNNFEEKFLDYFDGILPEEERTALEKALENDPGLRKSFEDYKKVISVENIINMQSHEISPNFAVKVMDKLEEPGFFRRLFMDMSLSSKSAAKIFASIAALVVVVQLYRTSPQHNVFKDRQFQTISAPLGPAEAPLPPTAAVSGDNYAGAPVLVQPLEERAGKQLILDGKGKETQSDKAIQESEALSFPQKAEQASQVAVPKLDGNRSADIKRGQGEGLASGLMSKKIASYEAGINSAASGLSIPAPLQRRVLHDDLLIMPPASYNESYSAYEENPRIEVSKEPSSTFGIDVDTASYTNTRRFLKEGRIPPKDSVRVEEFINYFDYNYPQQFEKPFSLSYELAPSPLEKDRYFLKLGVKAKDGKKSEKPWNLVFLVDVSGSMMDQNKLPLVQRSLRLLTENMKEGDKVGIVTYAGSAGTALEPTTIKEKQKILSAIDMLTAGGSTNGSGGIVAAYELAQKNKIDGAVNRVVLATDGDFNVGVTSQSELISLIEEKRKSGITLTTLGFGTGNIKDGTMEQLANKGNGNYFYIDSYKEARKVLETDLAGTMEVVAKDVKLQIEFNPQHVKSYRLIGYENRKLKREDFNNDAIDAGEIGTGHTVTAIYEIVLANTPLAEKLNEEYRYQEKTVAAKEDKPGEHTSELAFLKIRYKQPEGSESSLLSFPIDKSNIKNNPEEASADFRFAAAVTYFAQTLRGSSYKGPYTYDDIIKLAEGAKADDRNGYRQEFIELVKDAASIR